jgi:hypothetical protein
VSSGSGRLCWANHLKEFRRRLFDFHIAILVSPGFCRKQTAAMSTVEIAVRKFISPLRIHRIASIDSEMPFCVFAESVQPDKLILLIC